MTRQGRRLSEVEIKNIIRLLASTEMTIPEIATRIGCSKSAVVAINKRHSVRFYQGKHSRWKTAS